MLSADFVHVSVSRSLRVMVMAVGGPVIAVGRSVIAALCPRGAGLDRAGAARPPHGKSHGRTLLSLVTILGIAVGLAMDAFAVSIGVGLNAGQVSGRTTFRLAWHFGLFQFLMPVVGWLAGLSVERWISGIDHWVAFGLLTAIGGHMLYEAFRGDDEERVVRDPTRGASLVVLSVATSIDALAVGLSLALLGLDIWYPAVIIGIVAFAFTAAGLHLGSRFGALLGKRVEALGGVILIGIGVKILVDHLF